MVAPAVIAAGITAAGAVGGAGINAVSAKASNYKQYKYQSWLQAEAARLNYDYNIKSALNMSNATRQGLEKAGYNPMLAVQNGTSGANSSFTSAGQASAPDYVNAINSGIANAQSFQRLKNETRIADNTSKKLEAEGENLSADTANKLEENKYIGEKRKAEIANLQANTLEMEATIENMNKQIELGVAGLALQRELGYAGFATTSRGQDMVYNASTLTPSKYLIDKAERIYSSLGRPKTPTEFGSGLYNYYYNRRKNR